MSNRDPEKMLRVTEIFASIQGESTWAGLPCAFVRLAGCNLRCQWCDTAYSFGDGTEMGLGEILETLASYGLPLVEITGGEPLAQAACPELAQKLLEAEYTVLVETNGSLPIDVIPEPAVRIMDLKCPGSGECEKNHWPNVDCLSAERDEVKFVIASRGDYEWAREMTAHHTLEARCHAVLFSAVQGMIEARELAAWVLEDRLPVRLQLQLHKIIWPGKTQGV